MATPTKKRVTREKRTLADKTVNEYANDPFFIKKRETALKFIKKAGLPESIKKKR